MHCGNEFSYVWLWLKHWPKNQWLLDKIGIINFLVSKLSWTLVVAHKSFYLPLVQLCYLISSGSILRLHSSYTLTFHSSSPIRHSCLSIEKKKISESISHDLHHLPVSSPPSYANLNPFRKATSHLQPNLQQWVAVISNTNSVTSQLTWIGSWRTSSKKGIE